jgi:hypothetical protein
MKAMVCISLRFKTGDVQWQLFNGNILSNEFRGVVSLRQAHENPK